jgi:hypothetical protein
MKKILPLFFILLISYISFSQTKIDEYGGIIPDDEGARLDHFSGQLKADENAKGTIIIYKDKREPMGNFLRHFYGVKSFLITQIGVRPDKFSIVFGGENKRRTKIWLNESKNQALKIDDKLLDETLSGKITKKTLFDRSCLDCDPVVFINESIFGNGLNYFAKALQANPNTNALIEISEVEYISKTPKEKTKLVNIILEGLIKNNKISKNRIKIRYKSGYWTSFYIVPKIDKNNKK